MKLRTIILFGWIGITLVIHGCKDDEVEDCIDANILIEHSKSQVNVIRNTPSIYFERTKNGSRDTILFTKASELVDSIFLFPSSLDKPCPKGGAGVIALERERFVFTASNKNEVLDFQLVKSSGSTYMFINFKGYLLYHGSGCFLCTELEREYLFQSKSIKVHPFKDGLRKRNSASVEDCFQEKTGILELRSNVPSGLASAYFSKEYGFVEIQINLNSDSTEHWVRL
ncbi:MAG: hypothetical protein H6582_15240 [Crocinitomicaceae bacterium]|nr:hypothetical protein [Crocinitomicaceae bacterium]